VVGLAVIVAPFSLSNAVVMGLMSNSRAGMLISSRRQGRILGYT
jgi:hypothetical protein